MRALYRVICAYSVMKNAGDNHVFTEYFPGQDVTACAALYFHVSARSPAWHLCFPAARMPDMTKNARLRRKIPLCVADHLRVAELLWQVADMLNRAWKIVLSIYGAANSFSASIERHARTISPLSACRLWLQDHAFEALDTQEGDTLPHNGTATMYWSKPLATWRAWANESTPPGVPFAESHLHA